MVTNPTRQYVDLDLNFNANPISGDVSKSVGNLSVIRALTYLLRTNHFEVPFNPQQGGNITKLLFEPANEFTAQALQKEITNTVNNYEPRVSNLQVTVQADATNNGFSVTLTFFVNNQVDPVSVTMFLRRVA